MTKSRINITVQPIRTREQLEILVGEVATLKTREQKITAELNRRITELRQNYDTELGEIAEDITAKSQVAQDWAEANMGEFGQARSIDLTHGTVGFRTGQPALRTITGFTWDRVLEKIKAGGVWLGYIRTKEEIDKEQLLADRASYSEADLKKIGVRVVQVERFFVDPKIETVETMVKGEAQ